MGKPHVLVIPYPAQGHVIPLLEVSQCLADNGIKVTFVNTEFNHERVIKAFSQTDNIHELISLVSIPDGLESWDDRNDHGKLAEAMTNVWPGKVESLVEEINGAKGDQITCILTDVYMTGSMQVAEKFCIKKAAFLPASVALLALTNNAQKLVDDGIVDNNGTPLKNEEIQLSPSMPKMSPTNFAWCLFDITVRKIIFESILKNNSSAKLADRLICNSAPGLEPGALTHLPNCLPIGPLLAQTRLGRAAGNFWPEDPTCLAWLDRHPQNSVIYVAFGSFTIFDPIQFQELALGLEQTNRPFLWVVRQDITQDPDEAYPLGFKERVKNRAKVVHWAPQQQILSHASVACFLSHCGWNSTVECVGNGVPLLCWPYFADQFINQSYIVDHWGVGLGLDKDGSGIVRKDEIVNKVDKVLSDGGYRTKAMELGEKIRDGVGEGGCCKKNFHKFVDWIKEKN